MLKGRALRVPFRFLRFLLGDDPQTPGAPAAQTGGVGCGANRGPRVLAGRYFGWRTVIDSAGSVIAEPADAVPVTILDWVAFCAPAL